MNLLNWARTMFAVRRSLHGKGRTTYQFRPGIEALERRCLMDANVWVWTGASQNDSHAWEDATNWKVDGVVATQPPPDQVCEVDIPVGTPYCEIDDDTPVINYMVVDGNLRIHASLAALAVVNNGSGDIMIDGGKIVGDGSTQCEVTNDGTFTAVEAAAVRGQLDNGDNGTIIVDHTLSVYGLDNESVIKMGDPATVILVRGDFSQGSEGSVSMVIDGSNNNCSNINFLVGFIAGNLTLSRWDVNRPNVKSKYTLLSYPSGGECGAFDTMNGAADLGVNLRFSVEYYDTATKLEAHLRNENPMDENTGLAWYEADGFFAQAGQPIQENGPLEIGDFITAEPYIDPNDPNYGILITVDWGDGSNPETVQVTNGEIYADHTYTTSGYYTMKITMTDIYTGEDISSDSNYEYGYIYIYS